MNINRHNYEEFFILYLDNELSGQEREEVEFFVQQNPDLSVELEMLQQSRFVPDEDLLFKGKESLFRSSSNPSIDITITNYEEWLLLYNDNELTDEQKKPVEEFIAKHPQVKQELALFQQAKLQAEETIVFSDKESLYRKEEKISRRVVMMRWTRIAVAAVLLFAISITAFLLLNNENIGTNDPTLADLTETKPASTASLPPVTKKVANDPDAAIVSNPTKDAIKKSSGDEQLSYTAKQDIQHKDLPLRIKDTPSITDVATTTDATTEPELGEPVYTKNMTEPIEDNTYASLTNWKENNPELHVTSGKPRPFKHAALRLDDNDENVVYADQSEKKSRLRGFFRKVTRTFEKATNIQATDDDDRLLVAGLAIRL